MQLARRYAPHLMVLLALALIPVVLHSYAGVRVEDCADPAVLLRRTPFETVDPKREAWMKKRFNAHQWREGLETTPDGRSRLSTAIVRSYDAKRLYYRPERSLLQDLAPDGRELEWVANGTERLPIHRLHYPRHPARRSTGVAAYLLVYHGEPVANPYLAQLLSAPQQMITGSRPMTLFIVGGRVTESKQSEAEQRTREWLIHAWREYQAACRPSG